MPETGQPTISRQNTPGPKKPGQQNPCACCLPTRSRPKGKDGQPHFGVDSGSDSEEPPKQKAEPQRQEKKPFRDLDAVDVVPAVHPSKGPENGNASQANRSANVPIGNAAGSAAAASSVAPPPAPVPASAQPRGSFFSNAIAAVIAPSATPAAAPAATPVAAPAASTGLRLEPRAAPDSNTGLGLQPPAQVPAMAPADKYRSSPEASLESKSSVASGDLEVAEEDVVEVLKASSRQRPARWGPVCCLIYRRNVIRDETGSQVEVKKGGVLWCVLLRKIFL